jgi:hypothetical protein
VYDVHPIHVAQPAEFAQAHHIVPQGEHPADEARRALYLNCVDINEPANGIFLPRRYGDFFVASRYPVPVPTGHPVFGSLGFGRAWHQGTDEIRIELEPHTRNNIYAAAINVIFAPYQYSAPTGGDAIRFHLAAVFQSLRSGSVPGFS